MIRFKTYPARNGAVVLLFCIGDKEYVYRFARKPKKASIRPVRRVSVVPATLDRW